MDNTDYQRKQETASSKIVKPLILQLLSGGGATYEDLVDTLEKDENVRQYVNAIEGTVRGVLGILKQDGIVDKVKGEWVLLKPAPRAPEKHPTATVPVANGSSKIAPYFQGRGGKTVSLQIATDFRDVHEVQMLWGKAWIPQPLFGNICVYVGHDVPQIDPEQVTQTGANGIKFIFQNGTTSEWELDAQRDKVTFARKR